MKNSFIILLLFSYCSLHANTEIARKEYCRIAYDGMDKFSNIMKKDYNLTLEGRGGAMFDNIKTISLSYSTDKHLTIDQARELIIKISKRLIDYFNNKPDIRPYLKNFPFTIKNIELMISSEKINTEINQNYISLVSLKNSKIKYYGFNIKKNEITEIYDESYKIALEKLNPE